MADKKMIESLTQEQIDKFEDYVDRWTAIGLTTGPVDLEKAIEAAKLSYRIAKLPEPKNYYVAKSPKDAVDLIKTLIPGKSASDILQEMAYGSQDASWLSLYEYFGKELGIAECDDLKGLMDLSKHCGWVSFYDEMVVFQDRPEYIKFDDRGVLHCETGPAIRYSDGYSLYAWHGIVIPEDWIEKRSELTSKMALSWENIEQRRCACEIVGWAKILRDLNAKVIDSDDDPMIGNLLEVDIPDIGRERFLQVLCGTGRTFAIPVPPTMKTALEAQAWTYDMNLKDFGSGPEVRT